jgi:hypothetical protein
MEQYWESDLPEDLASEFEDYMSKRMTSIAREMRPEENWHHWVRFWSTYADFTTDFPAYKPSGSFRRRLLWAWKEFAEIQNYLQAERLGIHSN